MVAVDTAVDVVEVAAEDMEAAAAAGRRKPELVCAYGALSLKEVVAHPPKNFFGAKTLFS